MRPATAAGGARGAARAPSAGRARFNPSPAPSPSPSPPASRNRTSASASASGTSTARSSIDNDDDDDGSDSDADSDSDSDGSDDHQAWSDGHSDSDADSDADVGRQLDQTTAAQRRPLSAARAGAPITALRPESAAASAKATPRLSLAGLSDSSHPLPPVAASLLLHSLPTPPASSAPVFPTAPMCILVPCRVQPLRCTPCVSFVSPSPSAPSCPLPLPPQRSPMRVTQEVWLEEPAALAYITFRNYYCQTISVRARVRKKSGTNGATERGGGGGGGDGQGDGNQYVWRSVLRRGTLMQRPHEEGEAYSACTLTMPQSLCVTDRLRFEYGQCSPNWRSWHVRDVQLWRSSGSTPSHQREDSTQSGGGTQAQKQQAMAAESKGQASGMAGRHVHVSRPPSASTARASSRQRHGHGVDMNSTTAGEARSHSSTAAPAPAAATSRPVPSVAEWLRSHAPTQQSSLTSSSAVRARVQEVVAAMQLHAQPA